MEKYDGVILKPTLDEALEHYGVKGMKWKKHKSSTSRSSLPQANGAKNHLRNLTMRGYDQARGPRGSQLHRNVTWEEAAERLNSGIKAGRKRRKKNKLSEKWANRRKINYDLNPSNQAYEQLVNRQKKKK